MRRQVQVTIVEVGTARMPEEQSAMHRSEVRRLHSPLGPDALNLAQREAPHLMLLDAGADGADALELAGNLKSLPMTEDVPLLLLLPEGGDPSGPFPADAVLQRPFSDAELLAEVHRLAPLPERRHPRYPINLRFTYSSGDTVAQAFSRVISVGGAFLKTDRPVRRGTQLTLAFRLPGQETEIRCGGVVRNAMALDESTDDTPGFGVEFTGVAASDHARIVAFVDALGSSLR